MVKRVLAITYVLIGILLGGLLLYQFRIGFIDFLGFLGNILSRFFLLYALVVAVFIFLDNDDPHRTLSWLLVLILLPYVGVIFYILIGKNLIPRRAAKKKKESDQLVEGKMARNQSDAIQYLSNIDSGRILSQHSQVVKLLLKNSNSLFTLNNQVDILTNGIQTFTRIFRAMNEARETIHMEYFIIKEDAIGNKVKEILIRKAGEGVAVRVIYDAVGSFRLSRKFKNDLKAAGVEIHPFFPVIFPVITRELNYRNHRKILVIDGMIGFMGGLNIGDEYVGKNPTLGFWRDTHLRIMGEAVHTLQRIFISDWKFVSKEDISLERPYKRMPYLGQSMIQIAASGPDSDWQNIHQGFFSLIATAKEKIWMETPYLVPDESIRMALKTAALSGIDVKIIIPNKPDHFFVYWASRDNIEGLLEAGVRIYTYERGFIHSKILLVDGIAASVGTANMDVRSFGTNYEVNAFLYGKAITRRLEEDFMVDLKDSKEIDYDVHLKRSIKEKTLEAFGRLLSPLQ